MFPRMSGEKNEKCTIDGIKWYLITSCTAWNFPETVLRSQFTYVDFRECQEVCIVLHRPIPTVQILSSQAHLSVSTFVRTDLQWRSNNGRV